MSETSSTATMQCHDQYHDWLNAIAERVAETLTDKTVKLFITDCQDKMWNAYLRALPEEVRQEHNCHACRHFIERYGSLCTVHPEHGWLTPLVWDDRETTDLLHYDYKQASEVLGHLVLQSTVLGPFIPTSVRLGEKVTGGGTTGKPEFHHFTVRIPIKMLDPRSPDHVHQAVAEMKESFQIVKRALGEWSEQTIQTAAGLVASDMLYRGEQVEVPIKFLQDLVKTSQRVKNKKLLDNLIWDRVVRVPPGFCRPRSSMIGTLLDDLQSGMAVDHARARFAEKMNPLQYLRPQAAPSAGAVTAATKLVEEMGIEPAFYRREARLSEVIGHAVWVPDVVIRKASQGLFGDLQTKGQFAQDPEKRVESSEVKTMTWEKFIKKVLPTASELMFIAQSGARFLPFSTLTTAVNQDAPPIIRWDQPGVRNPMAWYFWHGGAVPSQYNLKAGLHRVLAILPRPDILTSSSEITSVGQMLVIEGARDQRTPGAALFPEILRHELHPVRSVIEAFSNSQKLVKVEEQPAAGLLLDSRWRTDGHNIQLGVTTTEGLAFRVEIDRWE
jgi:hypothetical protein